MLKKIKKILENHKREVISILQEIETETVAIEEYNLSIAALNNNTKYIKGRVNVVSSYMPMNLPLYSIILYSVVPKICSNRCYYRPSSKTIRQSKKIHKLLNLNNYNIYLFEGTRFDFFKNFVYNSDVVVFVGKPENADYLSKKLLNKTMFIYFGVGQNPVVLADKANLSIASKKIANTIMFNYGQDCAKPNVILCKKTLYKKFLEKLIVEIEKNMNQKTTIKDNETLKDVANLLIKEIKYIEYGGNIDFKNKTLNPIIIAKNLSDNYNIYDEYYAPIFRIFLYTNNTDLKKYFSNKRYKDENMNITIFGKSSYINNLPSSLVLKGKMVPEVDNGFCEFGGYGEKTSYVLYKGIKIVKPILINREIEYFFNNRIFLQLHNEMSITKSSKIKLIDIMYKEYKFFIQSLFKNNLNFAFVFGSYAKGNSKNSSDMDILVCIKKWDDDQVENFRKWYFKFHYMYGKVPDFIYPGEIVTEDQLNDIIKNNNNLEIKLNNNLKTFDALFYTQIFTDKKSEVIGNKKLLLKIESNFKNFLSNFCNQIYELLMKNKLIKNERDHMKCLVALACNDLLFFSRRLKYDFPKNNCINILKELDDGFLIKCLKNNQKI